MPLTTILISYFVGGITFIPLLLLVLLCHAALVLPSKHGNVEMVAPASSIASEGEPESYEKLRQGAQEADGAAGYFAVCREYVPGGVNGKPPSKTTPAGQAISAESPSVYQSMYRSIFERGKTQTSGIEAGTPTKRARNVFFVILRHGHLVLFDNAEQIEIRHVISLSHYDIDVYAGGDPIPEGELWIKRNCIRLRKKESGSSSELAAIPFYLFSDNCSEKEDFYHSMIQHEGYGPDDQSERPATLGFGTEDMIKLIRYLHVSEENNQNRWLNAIVGRLFLAVYQTPEVEKLIRGKIVKKMARVAKPAFVTSLRLDEIDLGNSAPQFVAPKLRDITVDGALTLETDVKYTGNFKAVIAAVARIDLGSRFKAREVNMILAGVLKRLEGHLLIKIKPPPSNRIWISFETLPKLDISLEPIVSSRQITYGVILRALVNRIREVVGETLVYPNWDDIPFTDTSTQTVRGGIWKTDDQAAPIPRDGVPSEDTIAGDIHDKGDFVDGPPISPPASISPVRADTAPSHHEPNSASPPGTPIHTHSIYDEPIDLRLTSTSAEKPKSMRSNSFAAAASPIVSKSPATTESLRRQAKKGQRDAAAAMKTLSDRSPDKIPSVALAAGLSSTDGQSIEPHDVGTKIYGSEGGSAPGSQPTHLARSNLDPHQEVKHAKARLRTTSLAEPLSENLRRSSGHTGKSVNSDRAKAINQSITSATVAARNWSWNMLNRQSDDGKTRVPDKSMPMGRGQPLPPPGTPLPKPEKPAWSSAALSTLRRKPVGSGVASFMESTPSTVSSDEHLPRPPITGEDSKNNSIDRPEVDVLTIDAPSDSPPTTPDKSSLHSTDNSSLAMSKADDLREDHIHEPPSSLGLTEEHYVGHTSEAADA